MKKLLVTGGAGFIGVNFVYYWRERHPSDQIIVLDKLTYAGRKESIASALESPNVYFYQGDIADSELTRSIMSDHQIDTVVNFAAESHVDRSITEPDTFIDTNIVGTQRLLSVCMDAWLENPQFKNNHRFHHVSTDEVYGSLTEQEAPFTEGSNYRPNSPYSASKAASDHLVRAYHKTYGLNTSVSHCGNNYGPYQLPEKLIPLCIKCLLTGKPMPVYGDGKNIRDWIYVEDHCFGLDLILSKGKAGQVFNIGGTSELQNLEVLTALYESLREMTQNGEISERFPRHLLNRGADECFQFVQDRLGHDRRYAIDSSKISDQLGFKAGVGFEEGIKRTIDWYLSSDTGWIA